MEKELQEKMDVADNTFKKWDVLYWKKEVYTEGKRFRSGKKGGTEGRKKGRWRRGWEEGEGRKTGWRLNKKEGEGRKEEEMEVERGESQLKGGS